MSRKPNGGGRERASQVQYQGRGRKNFWIPDGTFFSGVTPPLGGRVRKKKWLLQKKLFLPMWHVPHIITVSTTDMPLALVGIPLFGYLGYYPMSNMPFATCSRRWPLLHGRLRSTMARTQKKHASPKWLGFMFQQFQ